MNLFYVNEDPRLAARDLADRHVVKMTLETVQMISTVARSVGLDESLQTSSAGMMGSLALLYASTQARHPCTIWVASSRESLDWTVRHGDALGNVYTDRFGKHHKSHGVLLDFIGSGLIASLRERLPDVPRPPPARAVSDEARALLDPIEAYREHLRLKYAGWARPPRWTNATRPSWLDHRSEQNLLG